MDGTELLLRSKYAPETLPEAPESVELNKGVYALPLATKIALAKAQGLPNCVIQALIAQLEEGTE